MDLLLSILAGKNQALSLQLAFRAECFDTRSGDRSASERSLDARMAYCT